MNGPDPPVLSPTTRSNNPANSDPTCPLSPAPGGTDLRGKLFCSPDGAAFLVETQDHFLPPTVAPLSPGQLRGPLHSLHRVQPPAHSHLRPRIQHFQACKTLPSSGPQHEAKEPLFICIPCRLSFTASDNFNSHLSLAHKGLALSEDHAALLHKGMSSMLQSGVDGPELNWLNPLPPTEEPTTSPMELARNLMLASELSASRLLQQVNQSSQPMMSTSLDSFQRGPPPSPLSGGPSSLVPARNSCKTLKCPKCNWHYKYQETLEIHMKEKHPEAEVSCAYCLHGQAHPKLARGETYSCGYKPYRCDICKYSTTTKGNLSIHMQSDKHLNNVQELQQGGTLMDPTSMIHSQSPVSGPPTSLDLPQTPFRCEPCNYETTVARNLRIHMTSEKHNHNSLVFQGKAPGESALPFFSLPAPSIGSDLTSLYQCCVCLVFETDSVEELLNHVQAERSNPGPRDVSIQAGHHLCHLCQYKTHLKANFQLHTKTDKHIQRLGLVNHVREGGPQNEWRLAYLNANNPVQLRCNACNEFFTSTQKLASHATQPRHQSLHKALAFLTDKVLPPGHVFYCRLCDFASVKKDLLLGHLREERERQGGVGGGGGEEWVGIREEGGDAPSLQDMADAIHCCAWCNFTSRTGAEIDEHVRQQHGDGPIDSEDDDTPLACPLCQAECGQTKRSLETHLASDHNVPADRIARLLAVLPSSNNSPPASVPADSTVDSDREPSPGAASNGEYQCHVCFVPFSSYDSLCSHQTDSGHLELKETPEGPGYYCWGADCNQYFKDVRGVQLHYQESHRVQPKPANCISDRHAYRYRCSECSLAFRTEEKLQAHSLYHLMRASTRCAICQRTFRSIETLRRHVESDHLELNGPRSDAGLEGPESKEILSKPFMPQTKSLIPRRGERHSTGVDKYNDPNRPFKCEYCRESFTQRNIYVVHLNSVSHLHRVKKLMEQEHPNIAVTPDLLNALSKTQDPLRSSVAESSRARASSPPSSPQELKPYKCTMCNVSYSQGSTLDIHLRSVGHQAKLNKEMRLTGESCFPNLPNLDVDPGRGATSDQQRQAQDLAAAALMANMWMSSPFFQALQIPGMFSCEKCGSNFATDSALQFHLNTVCKKSESNDHHRHGQRENLEDTDVNPEDPPKSPALLRSRPSPMFKKLLQNYGFEVVMQFNEAAQQRKRKLMGGSLDLNNSVDEATPALKIRREEQQNGDENHASASLPEVGIHTCHECKREFSSIWVLKAHFEQVHGKDAVSIDEIEKVSEEVKEVLDKKRTIAAEDKSEGSQQQVVSSSDSAVKEEPATHAENTPVRHTLPPPSSSVSSSTKTSFPTSQSSALASAGLAALMGNVGGFPFMPTGFPNPLQGSFPNPFLPFPMTSLPDMSDMQMGFGGMPDFMKAGSGLNFLPPATTMSFGINPAVSMNQNQQKRARTRITDEQLKILREYFDINNSPTEQQIEEMSMKSGLPQKVIKHWFRNTLFKERQKNKDSPYNFSIPPSLGIDLEEYEKTGEAKVIQVKPESEPGKAQAPDVSKIALSTADSSNAELNKEVTVNDKIGGSKDVKMGMGRMDESLVSAATALSAQETLRRLTALPPQIPANLSLSFLGQNLSEMAGSSSIPLTSSSPMPGTDSMASIIANAMSPGGSVTGPGRRANRTRFTDYQLKNLQEFFERQAYPKDDDLEALSKKLQLSPRVIVVWFQNARQKARKVFENLPHAGSSERFTKTPGCNFQCKGCSLVFQRYYELIQHQQKHCFKDREPLDSEYNHSSKSAGSTPGKFSCEKCGINLGGALQLEEHLKVHANNPLLFAEDKRLNALSPSPGTESPARSEASGLVVQSKPRERKSNGPNPGDSFNKRCPFCGILFYSHSSMDTHLRTRHAEQCNKTIVNIDLLPDAEEVPTITPANVPGGSDEQGMNGNSLAQSMLSFGMLRNPTSATESMEVLKKLSEGVGSTGAPMDLSKTVSEHGGYKHGTEEGSQGGSPNNISYSQSDNEDSRSTFSQDSPSPHLSLTGGSGLLNYPRPPNKRYRTHLTPAQVQIMKSLFADYKTPSMIECELLGNTIGLHKRVVQVWFQNARAKERKAKTAMGQDPKLDDSRTTASRCNVCDLALSPKQSLQDHVFTREHIEKLREGLADGRDPSPLPRPPSPSHHTPGAGKMSGQQSRSTSKSSNQPAPSFNAQNMMPFLPGNYYANLAASSVMYPGGFPALPGAGFYDPNLHGTPVSMLQIPPAVAEKIARNMQGGTGNSCRFTQDGKNISELRASLDERSRNRLGEKDLVVGYGCRQCCTAFQSQQLLQNHQRMVCQSKDPAFQLIQSHYECNACSEAVGTQSEFLTHCSSAKHLKEMEKF